MSQISDVVAELRTIASAMTGVSTFQYGFKEKLNFERDKDYPVILFHRPHPYTYEDFHNKIRRYSLIVSVWISYPLLQQKTVDLEDRFAVAETLLEQYLTEFIDRSLGETDEVTDKQEWEVVNPELITVTGASPTHNDQLLSMEAAFDLFLFTNCDNGTFTYP